MKNLRLATLTLAIVLMTGSAFAQKTKESKKKRVGKDVVATKNVVGRKNVQGQKKTGSAGGTTCIVGNRKAEGLGRSMATPVTCGGKKFVCDEANPNSTLPELSMAAVGSETTIQGANFTNGTCK